MVRGFRSLLASEASRLNIKEHLMFPVDRDLRAKSHNKSGRRNLTIAKNQCANQIRTAEESLVLACDEAQEAAKSVARATLQTIRVAP